MAGFEFVVFLVGLGIGLWLGRRISGERMLSRMYKDDMEKARDSDRKRRDTFL